MDVFLLRSVVIALSCVWHGSRLLACSITCTNIHSLVVVDDGMHHDKLRIV